jgi:2-desacetyl-2-hydroxyethyl bacteriochlorophyllide A dehydrogenase
MTSTLTSTSVLFTAPRRVELHQDPLPAPDDGQLLVRTRLSGISAGTELMLYRGEAPAELAADEALPALRGDLSFPLQYGYCAVGQVLEAGAQVDQGWVGRRVFAFQPHTSCFLAHASSLLPLPDDLGDELALLLPSMETALHLVHEGGPLAGECVAVFGQGLVGLLTVALLARFPLQTLVTLEPLAERRAASVRLGAHASLDPAEAGWRQALLECFGQSAPQAGADLAYELSGRPETLNLALESTAYDGRVVVGSWYGRKIAALELGGRFHRSHLRIIASQVSRVQPELSGRWTKPRRLQAALEMLRRIRPSGLITHRFRLAEAAEAYQLLDQHPERALQVVLSYDG